MKTFSTLNEVFESAKTSSQQVTLQSFINRRMYIDNEWQDVDYSPELFEEVVEMILHILGGWTKNWSAMRYSLTFSRPQHCGLGRMLLERYGENAKFSYCAGQDYPAELREIRKYLAR